MGTSCAHCARRSNLSGTEAAASAQDGVAAWTARSYANSNAPSARTSSSRQSTRSPPHRAPWVEAIEQVKTRYQAHAALARRLAPRRGLQHLHLALGRAGLDSSTRYCATCRRSFNPGLLHSRAAGTGVGTDDRPAVGRDGRAAMPTPW